jgi:NitT/TauT family transport system substrate-binding protein
MGNGLLYIAQANGYFAREGLEASFQSHPSGLAALESALAGHADLAGVADTPLVFAAIRDQRPAIIATIAADIIDQGIVARGDRGIASIADLRGKRVGVALRTSGHFMLDIALVRHGIRPDAVVKIDLKPQQMADAIAGGEVDAVATWAPYLNRAQTALGANAVSFQGRHVHSYSFNLAGSKRYVDENPEALAKLLKALARAEQFAAEQPGHAQLIVANAMKLAPEAVVASWSHYQLRLSLDQRFLTLLEDGSRWAIRNRYVDRADLPNYLDIIHAGILSAVRSEAVTIIR